MPNSNSPAPVTSDAFFAAIVNSSHDAIVTKDLNGVITSWNQGATRIFGYTAAEAVGQPVTLLFPPDRINEEAPILARIQAGEVVDHYETVRRCKNGSLIDVSLTVSPLRDAQGRIVGASKIARDITEQKRAQERFRVTLASIGDAVIATDEKGRITFMNEVAAKLTGWPEAAALGQPLDDVFRIVNETTRRIVESPVTMALREGVVVGLANHTVLLARHGEEFPIDDSAAPIRGAAGQLIGVVLVFRDVRERRVAEIAANRLAAIVESSDDAIVSKNLQGIVQTWNPGAERIFGYTEAEMIGQSITRVIPDDRLDEEQQILARFQRGERVDHFQTVRRRKDGALVDISLTVSPIRNEEGEIVGASKIARDITALREAQAQLEAHARHLEARVRERTARLEEMVAELEAFSYSLSHDMRAPVRAIQSFTEIVLTENGPQLGDSAEYLRKVISAAARMDRLIQDVLAFARLSRTEIKVVPLDVDKLVRDILHERPELQEPKADVQIEGRLQPMLGHDASLTQCLTNLLDNAVKFVAPRTKAQVRISSQTVGDKVRLCVRDNGIGIEPETQRRLFAIFQRAETATRYQGTGVGLAIARKAAERMNGTIGIDSLPGQGSTFCIELPAAP
jgi:PAS domain S-box-containing protein